MDNKNGLRNIPLGILVGLATLILASGGATAWITWRTLNPKPPVAEFPTIENQPPAVTPLPQAATPAETPAKPETPVKQPDTSPAAAEASGQIYWLKDVEGAEGGHFALAPESISVPGDASTSDQIKAGFDVLLSKTGNPDKNEFTTIPETTRLLAASVEADGVHVNLSGDFEYGGGSASMIGRLGQVIYTATAFDPSAPVWISVDGKPLTLLGGEGLEVRQPISRDQFKQDFNL